MLTMRIGDTGGPSWQTLAPHLAQLLNPASLAVRYSHAQRLLLSLLLLLLRLRPPRTLSSAPLASCALKADLPAPKPHPPPKGTGKHGLQTRSSQRFCFFCSCLLFVCYPHSLQPSLTQPQPILGSPSSFSPPLLSPPRRSVQLASCLVPHVANPPYHLTATTCNARMAL